MSRKGSSVRCELTEGTNEKRKFYLIAGFSTLFNYYIVCVRSKINLNTYKRRVYGSLKFDKMFSMYDN